MRLIHQTARDIANNFRRVVKEKAQIQKNEVLLKAETQARVLKESIISLNKAPYSIRYLQLLGQKLPKQKASSTVATGRIEKHREDESKKRLKLFLARQKEVAEFERQNYEERQKFINDRLTVILGPERMKMPAFLPSGHNPIDPVIAEHNLKQYQENVLSAWEAKKAAQRREAEEAEANRQQMQANRRQIEAKVSYYRDRYLVRLEKLVSFGPQLAQAIDLFEAVLQPLNEWEAAQVVHAITWELLHPIQDLLNDCAREIPLEEAGSHELKHAWPMARMEKLFNFLNHQYKLPGEIIDMGRRLQALMQAVYNPTPFEDPLAPPKPKPYVFGSTFSWILKTSVSAPVGSGYSKLLAATAKKAKDTSAPPAGTLTALPADTRRRRRRYPQQQDSPQRTAVLKHVNTEHINLMDEAGDLVNRKDGKISANHRRVVDSLFVQLLDGAEGCEGLLEKNEGTTYRAQVQLCREMLDMLSLAQSKISANKTLRRKCDDVMKLWKT
ncbi:hypothetical protein PTNB73_08855 [Pyrenophora teres f. teres]|nr:hypothetical protein HRS9139_09079 [Pyrenophora teres f. teres]KAE8825134.1 hypothetical protein HRS9122_10233 [Pyrenophora teres f. teres]KAE8857607.1 hypothetical protein PTNB73_08855 [Pyrenophora teres f. teres]